MKKRGDGAIVKRCKECGMRIRQSRKEGLTPEVIVRHEKGMAHKERMKVLEKLGDK